MALLCLDAFGGHPGTRKRALRARLTTYLVGFVSYHVLVGLGPFFTEFCGPRAPQMALVSGATLWNNLALLGTVWAHPVGDGNAPCPCLGPREQPRGRAAGVGAGERRGELVPWRYVHAAKGTAEIDEIVIRAQPTPYVDKPWTIRQLEVCGLRGIAGITSALPLAMPPTIFVEASGGTTEQIGDASP